VYFHVGTYFKELLAISGEEEHDFCTREHELTVPEGTTHIDHGFPEAGYLTSDNVIFMSLIRITVLSIPASVRFIDKHSFYFIRINRLIIPEDSQLETIGWSAFTFISDEFKSLQQDIIFPESLRIVGPSAFYGCSFKNITFESRKIHIENSAFSSNLELENLIFSDETWVRNERRIISLWGFSQCPKLRHIHGVGVDYVGEKAFACDEDTGVTRDFVDLSFVRVWGGNVFKNTFIKHLTVKATPGTNWAEITSNAKVGRIIFIHKTRKRKLY